MTTSPSLTQLEQEVFDYLNDTPNAMEHKCEDCNGEGECEEKEWVGEEFYSVWETCKTCKGTGKLPGARIETLAARISHEMDVRYSEALVIVERWRKSI